jgi:dimethylhistidine N-methyltransferase
METEQAENEQLESDFKKQFAADLIEGMAQTPKKMYSKYFYDERGDELFQSIMKMDEYYLTAAEYEIFSMQKEKMVADMKLSETPFQLIEFGAGDGYKTKVLLRFLLESGIDFEYMPIDISSTALEQLESSLAEELPDLKVRPIAKDYFSALEDLKTNNIRKVILFLGSNIGNFTKSSAPGFLTQLSDLMNEDDLLLMGVDLKKDPNVILAAYNDKNGITRAFNLNLLNRINQELGGDFDIFNFEHFPIYDPVSGATKSYLISKREQTVCISSIDLQLHFEEGEPIDMEISQKYSIKEVEQLAERSGFKVEKNYYDCKHLFTDTLWRKK